MEKQKKKNFRDTLQRNTTENHHRETLERSLNHWREAGIIREKLKALERNWKHWRETRCTGQKLQALERN